MSCCLDTNYKHYYIIHVIHKSKLFVFEKNIIFQYLNFLIINNIIEYEISLTLWSKVKG
jgi:hypothetical protein